MLSPSDEVVPLGHYFSPNRTESLANINAATSSTDVVVVANVKVPQPSNPISFAIACSLLIG